ncbi:hypothetical protein QMK17_00790 [Rhodococcus sp. G-MC3]|uniref:hypothetical protein n=1 Tax=Rhodococcus sp. G-MC3 TaxID=3046209 RepID=UPI0024BA301E|nr:hypothetical protein [Rhodococcus sp. G-MC3]MDJ0391866.1 hypothetical protein [Rhodococcus sp. G-MC3]
MSSLPRSLSRRTAFRMTASVALATAGLVTSAACSSSDDTAATVDTLTMHLRLAKRDAAAAGALIAVLPDLADSLIVVQSERSAHAVALQTEIDRVAGGPAESSTAESSTAAPAPTAVQSAPPPLDELRTYLSESQRAAVDSARNESGYRAGLLGSISAACAVESAMVLT